MSEITTADAGAGPVSLADVERLCWHLSGWSVEQRSVDELLTAVQAYAGSTGVESSGAAAPLGVGGAGGPQAPHGPSADLSVTDETQAPPPGPQTGVQGVVPRLHLTGTLTLICPGKSGARPRKRAEPRTPLKITVDGAVPEDTRTCRKCRASQPIAEFIRDSHGLRGRKTVCRTCENTRKRDTRRARKDGGTV